jgi:hypothetical protein
MRNKLQKFSDFANSLLPHETAYLLSIQQFQDKERLEILQQIDKNCQQIQDFTPFDENIDKRKYSHLKQWIEEHLGAIDVDAQYNQLVHWHQHLMMDTIASEEEKNLLKTIREYPLTMDFYFVKFYDLVKDFRQYLLIRMRHAEHEIAHHFITTYQEKYNYCRSVADKMYEATRDMVNQYAQKEATESIVWEEWLTARFYDDTLDGLTRYFALVRLTFIYNNYRQFEKLKDKYDYIDTLFKKGSYYSKRLLVNYYSNCLLLHTRFKEYDKAQYYGYLSIRVKNSDYLHYVNNLCAILLRGGKNEAALALMRQAHPEMKHTQSFHNKVGFLAFYGKCLNVNGLWRNAENYIETFLNVYKTEIFEQRWHIFFTTYLESLLGQRKYRKLLQVVKQYKLLDKEKQYRKNATHLPTILLFNALCDYKEDITDLKDLKKIIAAEQVPIQESSDHFQQFKEVLKIILQHLTDKDRAYLNQIKDKIHAV